MEGHRLWEDGMGSPDRVEPASHGNEERNVS